MDDSLSDAMDIEESATIGLEPQTDKSQMSLLSYFPTRGHTRISKSEPPQNHMFSPVPPNEPEMGYNHDIGPDPQSSTQAQNRPRPHLFRRQAFQSTLAFYNHTLSSPLLPPTHIPSEPLAEADISKLEMDID